MLVARKFYIIWLQCRSLFACSPMSAAQLGGVNKEQKDKFVAFLAKAGLCHYYPAFMREKVSQYIYYVVATATCSCVRSLHSKIGKRAVKNGT